MAVGSLGGDDGLVANGPGIGGDGKPLTEGQSVEYWSTSKSKWIEAIVKAVDDQGAVQLSVKPNVWVSGLEQVAKVTVPPQPPPPSAAAPAAAAACAQAAPAGAPVAEMRTATGQPDKSRQLFSLFAEWDAKQHRDSRPAGAAEGEAQPNAGAGFAEGAGMAGLRASTEQLRQMEEALLEQPQRSMRKRVPSLIWRAFYREIRGRAAELRRLQGAPAERARAAQLEGELATVLGMAEAHLQRLCSAVQRRLCTAASSSAGGAGGARAARRLARLHCLGLVHTMLADVERYRVVHRLGEVPRALQRAERLYRSALGAFPQIGQAFNQRGLLAAYRGDRLSAVLCGFRALLCTFAFPNSRENLLVWLGPEAQAQAPGEGAQSSGHCGRSAAALFRLHHSLLRAEECGLACMDASNATFARYEDLATCAERQIHDALAAMQPDSEEGEQWLFEVLMVSVCAAVYHVRKAHAGSSSGHDPCNYSTAPTLEAAGPVESCSDAALTGPAARAWDWVLRLGLLLAKVGEGARAKAPCLAGPTLLALLCARLLPGLWAGSKAAPLREAFWLLLGVNINRGESTAMREEELDLLQFSLPEDCLVVGLVALPPVAAAAGIQSQQASGSSRVPEASGDDDDDGSDDEVVLCSPVVHTSPPSQLAFEAGDESLAGAGSRFDAKQQMEVESWAFPVTKPAPEGSQTAARRARLHYHLGLGDASGAQGTVSGCGAPMLTHHLPSVDREASSKRMAVNGGPPRVASRDAAAEAVPQEGQGLFAAAHAFANTRHLISDPSPPLPPPPPPGLLDDDGCTLPNFDLGFLDDDSRDVAPSFACKEELAVPPPPPSAPPPAPQMPGSSTSRASEVEVDGHGAAHLLLAKQLAQHAEPATREALLMAVKGPPPGLPPPPPPPAHPQPCTPGMGFHGGVGGAGSNV